MSCKIIFEECIEIVEYVIKYKYSYVEVVEYF